MRHIKITTEGDTAKCEAARPVAKRLLARLFAAAQGGFRRQTVPYAEGVTITLEVNGEFGRARIKAEGGHVFYCVPKSDAAPDGWGTPFTPDNRPLGTPGGEKPGNTIQPLYTKAGVFDKNQVQRGKKKSVGNIDWVWKDDKGRIKGYLTWDGPAGRSMPFFESWELAYALYNGPVIKTAVASPDAKRANESPKRYLGSDLYLNGKRLISFDGTVHGAAIRKLADKYYLVAVIGRFDVHGTHVLKSAKILLDDARNHTGQPVVAGDILSYPGLFESSVEPVKYENICFFFNQSGTQAVGVIPVKKEFPAVAGPTYFFKTAKILVSFGNDGLAASVESEISPDYMETMVRTASSTNDGVLGGYETYSISENTNGSCGKAIVACDFVVDELKTVYASISYTLSSSSTSTGRVEADFSSTGVTSGSLDISIEFPEYSYVFSSTRMANSSDSGDVRWSSTDTLSAKNEWPVILYIDVRYNIFMHTNFIITESDEINADGGWEDIPGIFGGIHRFISSQTSNNTINKSAAVKTSWGDSFTIMHPDQTLNNPYRLDLSRETLDYGQNGTFRYFSGLNQFAMGNACFFSAGSPVETYQLAIQPEAASLDKDNIFLSMSLPPVSGDWGLWYSGSESSQHFHKIYHKNGILDASVTMPITGENQRYTGLGVF